MAINFPNNPSDGDTHVASNLTYTYDAAKGIWNISDQTAVTADLSNVATNILPTATNTYNLGSDARRWNHLYLNGNSLFLGGATISSTGSAVNLPAGSTVDGTAIGSGSGGGVEVLADMAALIAKTGMSAGDQAFISATNGLYIYNGTGWYLIASVTNESPTAITGVNSAYSLATDGTPTVITAVSSDPEGFPLTWSYAVTSGSLGTIATVGQADNVFTITPGTTDPDDAGTFEITFSATDGTTGAVSAASTFTLSFATASKKLTGSGFTTTTGNQRASFLRTGGLGVAFSADGSKMYHCTFTSFGITEYDLSTPWDINTATELGDFVIEDVSGMMMTADGNYFVAVERSGTPVGGSIAVYATQTAHSVIGATMVGSAYNCNNVPNYGSVPNACGISADGTKLWWQHQSSNKSVFATLSTPWNASTATLGEIRNLDATPTAGTGNTLAAFIDRNGAVIHYADWSSNAVNETIRQYVLQTPWTWTATETDSYISSNTTDHTFANPSGSNWQNTSITFAGAENPTGNNVFISEYGGGSLTQFAATVTDI
jgi:hypothetical protein